MNPKKKKPKIKSRKGNQKKIIKKKTKETYLQFGAWVFSSFFPINSESKS
jgi:hypothetical protein